MAVKLLPGITREQFARSTLRDIEAQIEGAKWRIEVRRDIAATQALLALAKWEDTLSLRTMLGRDPMDLDERVTAARRAMERSQSPYERQIEEERTEAVRERLARVRAAREARGLPVSRSDTVDDGDA